MEGKALKVWEERRDIITPVNGRVDGLGEHLVAARATGVHEDKVTGRQRLCDTFPAMFSGNGAGLRQGK